LIRHGKRMILETGLTKEKDLRDRPDQREEMYKAFENALIKYNRPFIELNGSIKERTKIAIIAIDKLLESRMNLDSYSGGL